MGHHSIFISSISDFPSYFPPTPFPGKPKTSFQRIPQEGRILTGKNKTNGQGKISADDGFEQAPSEISVVHSDEKAEDNVIVIHEHHHHHHHKNVTDDSSDKMAIPSEKKEKFTKYSDSFYKSRPKHEFSKNNFVGKVIYDDSMDQSDFEADNIEKEEYYEDDKLENLFYNLYSQLYGQYLKRNGYENFEEVAREDIEDFIDDGFTPIIEIDLDWYSVLQPLYLIDKKIS